MGTNECRQSAKVKKGGNDPYFVTSCFENKNDEIGIRFARFAGLSAAQGLATLGAYLVFSVIIN
jgi:hypothetical protein